MIAALRPDPPRDVFIWDSEIRGFGVRVKPSGRAAYLIQYRTAAGATRRLALGPIGTLTLDEARKLARLRLADVAYGLDPSAARQAARGVLTVSDLCQRYLEAARAGLVMTRFGVAKRPSTILIDEGRVARHIVPLLGSRAAKNLTRTDVQKMVDAIAAGKTAGIIRTGMRGKAVVTGGAGTAARVVELLGGIWTWAERRSLVEGTNPARGVEKHRGAAKDRVLAPAELAALGAAIRDREAVSPLACAAARLIALSGLRRDEACSLRWAEIDWEGSCLRLDQTKTGRSTRPIGKAAMDHLTSLPRFGEYVFPARNGSGRADLKKSLADLFDSAGLPDARSHDLCRTFASTAAALGFGDATIAELLGHARRGVTERHYVRRPDAALVAAANQVSGAIAEALGDDIG